jgi:hypothetical protein
MGTSIKQNLAILFMPNEIAEFSLYMLSGLLVAQGDALPQQVDAHLAK